MHFNHKCHFHPHQTICKFCPQKQCTLPLCPECEPIHLQEHASQHQNVKLLRFNEAYQLAYDQIQQYLEREHKIIKQCERQIDSDREAVIKFIDSYYANVTKALEQTKGKCHQIEQKMNKLKKGSIKTLIFFFSGDIELQNNQIEFDPLMDRLDRLSRQTKQEPTPKLYNTKYQPQGKQFHLPKDYNKINSISTTKQAQISSIDQGNVFNKIEEIAIGDRTRQKTRKSIFDNARRSNINEQQKPQLRSPSNKYSYNINPAIQNQEENDIQFITRHSPQLHKDYSANAKVEIKQKPATQQEVPVSFENRYKFTGSEQYQTYKKQREDKLSKDFSFKEIRKKQDKENVPTKVLRPSDLDIPIPKQENIGKSSAMQSQVNSQRLRSYSHATIVNTEIRNSVANDNKNDGLYDLKKQILAPQEIRKMLEKRMQERNRILSIKKSENYGPSPCQAQGATKKGWETRDSIINQIYNQHKN